MPEQVPDADSIVQGFDDQGYVIDEALATSVYLLLTLHRPLLIEGAAGVGKTELALALANHLGTNLIRLQCYEGLDANTAIYEWNYQRQLLAIKLQEASDKSIEEKEAHIFSEQYLLKRPLLHAITQQEKAPVLLIDEIDRADAEFEAFLLELLSAFQITIPEIGTIEATHVPHVILTSNGTRELGDALRRRCLYTWLEYPTVEKELQIVKKHVPDAEAGLAQQVVEAVHRLRNMDIQKKPGAAETIDWVAGLAAIGSPSLDRESAERTPWLCIKNQGRCGCRQKSRFGKAVFIMVSGCIARRRC